MAVLIAKLDFCISSTFFLNNYTNHCNYWDKIYRPDITTIPLLVDILFINDALVSFAVSLGTNLFTAFVVIVSFTRATFIKHYASYFSNRVAFIDLWDNLFLVTINNNIIGFNDKVE